MRSKESPFAEVRSLTFPGGSVRFCFAHIVLILGTCTLLIFHFPAAAPLSHYSGFPRCGNAPRLKVRFVQYRPPTAAPYFHCSPGTSPFSPFRPARVLVVKRLLKAGVVCLPICRICRFPASDWCVYSIYSYRGSCVRGLVATRLSPVCVWSRFSSPALPLRALSAAPRNF